MSAAYLPLYYRSIYIRRTLCEFVLQELAHIIDDYLDYQGVVDNVEEQALLQVHEARFTLSLDLGSLFPMNVADVVIGYCRYVERCLYCEMAIIDPIKHRGSEVKLAAPLDDILESKVFYLCNKQVCYDLALEKFKGSFFVFPETHIPQTTNLLAEQSPDMVTRGPADVVKVRQSKRRRVGGPSWRGVSYSEPRNLEFSFPSPPLPPVDDDSDILKIDDVFINTDGQVMVLIQEVDIQLSISLDRASLLFNVQLPDHLRRKAINLLLGRMSGFVWYVSSLLASIASV